MDICTLEKHFVDARRLTFELLHRRYLARKAFSQLCVEQAIRQAGGVALSTYEKCELRNLSIEWKDWQSLALLQVAVLKGARRALMWGRANVRPSRRA